MTAIGLLLARLWQSRVARVVIYVAVIFGIMVLSHWLAYRTGMSRGSSRAHAEDIAHEQTALAAAEKRYRDQEKTHEKQVEELRVKYAQQQASEQAVDARAATDLASGARRVRLPVVRCSSNTTQVGPSAGRADDAGTAELAPATAAALYAIAADGDKAIRQLTALQAWARSAVALCNGGRR